MKNNERIALNLFKVNSLLDLSLSINSTMTLENILESTHDTLFTNFHTFEMVLYMQRSLSDRYYSYQSSFTSEYKNEKNISDNGKLSSFFSKGGKPSFMRDLDDSVKLELIEIVDFTIELVIPCFVKHELCGFLFMGKSNKGGYVNEDLEYLRLLTQVLGLALENTHLMLAATYDSKTNLYLYPAAEVRIKKEIYRANRYKQTLSILILDIDFFKAVNDTYGHMAGDYVLSVYGKIINESIRESDIAVRFGGEEFLIACPCQDMVQAQKLGLRIQKSIKDRKFIFDAQEINTTVSIGIAEFDQVKYPTFEKLVSAADKALYHSKEKGRNCITLSNALEVRGNLIN